jgi:hypothetical protein
MPIRTALMACALVLGISLTITAASAGEPYGGLGPSEPATQDAGSAPDQEETAPDDNHTLPWLQQQRQNQPGNQGGEWDQQGAADVSDIDDASGH